MKSRTLLLCGLMASLLAACGIPGPGQEAAATAPPATVRPTATLTPLPTNTPRPTATTRPSPTPQPTLEPVPIDQVENALRADGYRRFPLTGGSVGGYAWVKESAYEQVTTWEDGTIELEVLHDPSPAVRLEHMERKFEVLDPVFPEEFMAALRQEHARYNQEVGPNVSGEPVDVYAYGDEWKTIWGEYNVSETEIPGYAVRFSLWWWQSTCPPQYEYCYYEEFPGLEFTGDSSFVFHTIFLWPLMEDGPEPST